MRVLICAPYYPPYVRGGGELSTEFLVKGLQAAGATVEVLTAFRSDVTEEVDGVKVHRVTSPNLYWSFDSHQKPAWAKALWHLREGYGSSRLDGISRVIDEFAPDVLHTSGIEDISPRIWPLAKKKGLPVVHTLRSFTLICVSATLRKGDTNCQDLCLSCRLASFRKRSLSSSVDAVIGISKFILDRHVALGFFPKARQYVVRNIALENPSAAFPPRARRSGPLAIGFLGRLFSEKGVERILTSLRLLDPAARPVLWIAGWGEDAYVAGLKDAARGLDVHFLGKVPPEELFSKIDVLIVPSLWHEPLGRIVLEANASGLPVLAARRGGIPEVVREGATGWLFEPDDAAELTGWLQRLTAQPDLARDLEAACREEGGKYAPASIAHEHLAIYERAIMENQTGSRLPTPADPPAAAGRHGVEVARPSDAHL